MAYVTPNNIDEKAKQWLEKIKDFNVHDFDINPGKTALMVIDMQKFFLDPKSGTFTEGGLAVIPKIQKLIAAFRSKNLPVIFTEHVHHEQGFDLGIMGWWWKSNCVEGSPDSVTCDELMPLPNEKIIRKHRYSAFYNTDLETVLRSMKIEDLVISGIMTNMCCESTARDAYYRDYRVSFLADATGAINEEMHCASLLNLSLGFANITTADKIINQL